MIVEPQAVITLGVAFIGLLGIGITYLGTRGKTKTDAKTALDARIDARLSEQMTSAWNEIDELKKKYKEIEESEKTRSAAIARILRAIARQWPDEFGPDIDTNDIAIVEELMPPAWVRKNRKVDS